MKLVKNIEESKNKLSKVSDEEAEQAFRTIIEWIGEDPDREGLIGTPKRLIKAFKEYFQGYSQDAKSFLSKTFSQIEGYDDMVVEKNIAVESHCEHHIAPIIGVAHIAYIPTKNIVGLSKLARVVEVFSKRLQIQEKLTAQIANTIDEILKPKGVGVIIEASHLCIATRGVRKETSRMVTSRMLGLFRDNSDTRREFMDIIGYSKSPI